MWPMGCFPARISTCVMSWSGPLRQASPPSLLEKFPESQFAMGIRPSHVDTEGCLAHALVSYSENCVDDELAWFICGETGWAEKKTANPPNRSTAADKSHVVSEIRLILFSLSDYLNDALRWCRVHFSSTTWLPRDRDGLVRFVLLADQPISTHRRPQRSSGLLCVLSPIRRFAVPACACVYVCCWTGLLLVLESAALWTEARRYSARYLRPLSFGLVLCGLWQQ